uniref:Uncharacterized protein n=1 Tax=Arundo donax TaxID=35708 RepID=A0A0A9AP09_ARUDO
MFLCIIRIYFWFNFSLVSIDIAFTGSKPHK